MSLALALALSAALGGGKAPLLPGKALSALVSPRLRGLSKDSRAFGPIPKSLIVGRAFIRVWPISNITLL